METTTTEKQIEALSNAVTRSNDLIGKMDAVIDFIQRRKMAFIDQRAQLTVLKDMLMPRPATKEVAVIIGTGAAVGYFVEKVIEVAEAKIDKDTAKVEQELKEQKEWFDNVHSASSGH